MINQCPRGPRLAADVHRVQAHDVRVAQLAQQHDLTDGGRRDAVPFLRARLHASLPCHALR